MRKEGEGEERMRELAKEWLKKSKKKKEINKGEKTEERT